MLPVIYRPEAAAEMREARRWYDAEDRALGRRFVHRIDQCVRLIRTFPLIFPKVHGDIRGATVRQFPYCVLYLPTADTITVFSIFHTSREPRGNLPPSSS